MLQSGEIVIIALLALVVFGPKRLPEMARKVGRWTAELRSAAREITAGLQAEVDDLRQVGEELRTPLDEVKKPLGEIKNEVAGSGMAWTGPKPISGPTPEDAMRDLEEMNRLADDEDAVPGDSEDESEE